MLFDGESTYGWRVHDGAHISAAGGVLKLAAGKSGWAATNAQFADFVLVAQYRSAGESLLALRVGPDGPAATGAIRCKLADTGGRWQTLKLRLARGQFSVEKDGKPAGEPKPIPQARPVGSIALAGPGRLELKTLKLLPLGAEPIFNGKDLKGWRVHPRSRSIYSVTPNGCINVRNGPGDLQTDRQWADFILQLDIFVNGDHLNSGIFFRSLPGQFWMGYESQIRNEWVTEVVLKNGTRLFGSCTRKNDHLELTVLAANGKRVRRRRERIATSEVEELIEHRDKPIDFGTGGIYGRVPARKVVSNDREWFTMTVLAVGNYMSVWVNGYQVSQFRDTRPPSENARRGCKTTPGAISIQGHDPTTDLSFRNIRIVELPVSGRRD